MIVEILQITHLLPRFDKDEDNVNLMVEISKGELLKALHSFQKDKSPGPNGWPIEFYLGLYYIIRGDLLKVVEESRSEGLIHSPHSAFNSLTPEDDNPSKLDDFRPISLCNFIYKVISKVIARRIKEILRNEFLKNYLGSWRIVKFTKLLGFPKKVYTT